MLASPRASGPRSLRRVSHELAGQAQDLANSAFGSGEYTEWQIKRSAKLVERLVDFKLKLDRCASSAVLVPPCSYLPPSALQPGNPSRFVTRRSVLHAPVHSVRTSLTPLFRSSR